jgi:hypothetical protein
MKSNENSSRGTNSITGEKNVSLLMPSCPYKKGKLCKKSITSDNSGGMFFTYSLKTAFSLFNLKIRKSFDNLSA